MPKTMDMFRQLAVVDPLKPYSDPDYDDLLDAFSRECPDTLARWKSMERDLFAGHKGLGKYPDLKLMKTCRDFIKARIVDHVGGLGDHRAWQAIRGRILRSLIDQDPKLNPAPGKLLLTEPRTLTDDELVTLLDGFRDKHPGLWADWLRIEAEGKFDDDPLAEISIAFIRYAQDQCWVESLTAVSTTFFDVRGHIWRSMRAN
jgi:hypothetical protein